MKTEEARAKMLTIIQEKGEVTPQQINYSDSKIAFVQIYSIAKILETEKIIVIEQKDKMKVYRMAGTKSTSQQVETKEVDKLEKGVAKTEEPEVKPKKAKTGGRDLSTYKFQGEEYNKGRLALALIKFYVADKKPSLKQAMEMWPAEIVRPYGLINEKKQAHKLPQRFFIKSAEEIKLKDGVVICVSNQMTPDRINAIIKIARKTLKYTIK